MRVLAFALLATIVLVRPALSLAADFAPCASAPSPPACLAERSIDLGSSDFIPGLSIAIGSGAVDFIAAHPDWVVREMKANRLSARPKIAVAAAALAAAATRGPAPHADPVAARLIAEAGGSPQVNELAVALWGGLDSSDWFLGHPGDPPGLTAIWDAVLAKLPRRTQTLLDLGQTAAQQERFTHGLALSRMAAGRRLSAGQKSSLAYDFAARHDLAGEAQALMDAGGDKAKDYDIPSMRADIARARLKQGYDAAAAATLVEAQRKRIDTLWDIFVFTPADDDLDALAAAAARGELTALAAAYLSAARETAREPDDRGNLYALASEALRLAGDRPAAAAAAREGLAMIPLAVGPFPASPADNQARRQAAVQAVYGVAPAIALHRAGEEREALDNGYLTGWDRYRGASLTGEPGDPLWLIDDHSWWHIEIAAGSLAGDLDRARAARLLDALPAARGVFDVTDYSWNKTLGLLAATAGRPEEARAYLSAAARALDDPEDGGAYLAGELARTWRKALIAAPAIASASPAARP